MEQSPKIVLSLFGAIIGAILAVCGFVLEAFDIARMIGITAGQWTAVGATLFFVCNIFLLVKHQKSLVVYRSMEPLVSKSPEKFEGPLPVPEPSSPLQSEPTVVVPTSRDVEGRLFLDDSPFDLLDKFSGMTDYKAGTIKKNYLGKWLTITGDVVNVKKIDMRRKKDDVISILCRSPTLDASEAISVGMRFNADQWEGHLAHLERGDQITVLGELEDTRESIIFLINCEISPSA